MYDDEIKRPLFANGIGKQFFEGLAFFEVAERRLAFLEIFLRDRVTVFFGPFAACPKLGLIENAMWGRTGQITGIMFGTMAWVTALWMGRAILRPKGDLWHCRSIEGVVSGFLCGLGSGLHVGIGGATGGVIFGGFLGLGIVLILGLSHKCQYRVLFGVTDGLIVGGLIGWLIYVLITWLAARQVVTGFNVGLIRWMDLWLYFGLGIAVAAGLLFHLAGI